jgi:hypothetical protein
VHRFIFLFTLIFPTLIFAIHDTAEINIIPQNENINFCFNLDKGNVYFENNQVITDKLYLVGTLDQQNFFSILPAADRQSVLIAPFKSDNNDYFQTFKATNTSICSGNLPKTSLNNLKLFAGVGKDLTDVLQHQKYLQVFSGFTTLPQPSKEWTVMVYMVGADLETNGRAASKDILEMLSGTQLDNQSKINVVLSTGGSQRGNWHNLKRTFINQGQSYVIEDKGDITPSTPENLTDFVMWSKNNFPAQHYALVLWNHGDGVGGFGIDDAHLGSKISFSQLQQAYQNIRAQFTKPLDIVVYDACLMGTIEVAEITSSLSPVMAASTDTIPAHGLDYQYILSNLISNPISDGIGFGKLAKTGYFNHAKTRRTYNNSAITYGVYDLTKLADFTKTFKDFATEFKAVLQQQGYSNYINFSQGIIRAPGYPQKGGVRSFKSLEESQQIRIDLYNVLQTVSPDFSTFGKYAQTLLKQLVQMVVDYESNLSKINPDAGRISLNIGAQKDYLSALPDAYTALKDGLDYYNQRRRADSSNPDKTFICPQGLICADAKWLQLPAEDTSGVMGYYGQFNGTTYEAYLIKSLYKHQALTQSLEIPVDGKQACRVEMCVSPTECEGITLSEMGEQRLAEIQYNQSPALLTFCKTDNLWTACSILPKVNGVWGRESSLSLGDTLTPNLLSISNNQTQQRTGKTLTVQDANTVLLQEQCDTQKASVVAGYAGFNQTEQFERLCDKGDCFCKESDLIGDEACKRLGVKSGVFLKY